MKNLMKGCVAALAAAASIVIAIPASAQPWRDSDRDGRSDRREWNRDRDRDGRPDQWDRRDNRRDWNRGARYRGDNGWHRGHGDRRWRYYGGNYGYEGYGGRWRAGQRYPYWHDRSYYITDYGAYGLPAPRRGYRYYRADNGDIVMVAIATGMIGLILGGALAD